jgi:hypothetical protein
MMTTRRFQAAKRHLVRAFLQGMGEAIHVFKSDPVAGQKVLSKWMRTQDKTVLQNAYRSYAPRISYPPYSNLTGIQVVIDDLALSRADAK